MACACHLGSAPAGYSIASSAPVSMSSPAGGWGSVRETTAASSIVATPASAVDVTVSWGVFDMLMVAAIGLALYKLHQSGVI